MTPEAGSQQQNGSENEVLDVGRVHDIPSKKLLEHKIALLTEKLYTAVIYYTGVL